MAYPVVAPSSAGSHGAVPTAKDPLKSHPPAAAASPSLPPRAKQRPSPSEQLSSATIARLLEPAADGAPSPESIRQLERQMKRVPRLHPRRGHRAASSESSSMASMAGSDRPPWEVALENMSLVRRSSIRSTDSSVPCRDRPDSVQAFGKSLFHRPRKAKRHASSRSSSTASSVYSAEASGDNGLAGPRDFLLPAIFSRRKASRGDHGGPRRLHISGPFNFQHVAHRRREDHAADLERANLERANLERANLGRANLGRANLAASPRRGVGDEAQARGPPLGSPASADERHGGIYDAVIPRPPLVPRHTAPGPGPRRLMMKHARSQEQLQTMPSPTVAPSPPSPSQSSTPSAPSPVPVPPPRVSSLQPNHQELHDVERPQTNTGFRRPRPFSPFASAECLPQLEFHRDNHPPIAEGETASVPSSPGEAAWPLACTSPAPYEAALPDVPEEDEHHGPSRRSRLSLVSDKSSLRGSQSVPALRSMAGSQRPMSCASETLGRLDTAAAARPMADGAGAEEEAEPEATAFKESWEDDIDYCYEHETEANCDYPWHRPSLETARRDDALPAPGAPVDQMKASGPAHAHRSMGSPPSVSPCMPALSPSSQASIDMGHEAVTPTPNPLAANKMAKGPRSLDWKKSSSTSFREPQGLSLSPSLFIPGDYQQQMLLRETEYEQLAGPYHHMSLYDEGVRSPALRQRSSTYTTTTSSTSRSSSTEKRHMSAASSWTTFTRRTASSTSLNKMAGPWADEGDHVAAASLASRIPPESEPGLSRRPSRDVVAEHLPLSSVSGVASTYRRGHPDEATPAKPYDVPRPRRQRARTTSLGTPVPPPVGQYALFPRFYVKTTGDQI